MSDPADSEREEAWRRLHQHREAARALAALHDGAAAALRGFADVLEVVEGARYASEADQVAALEGLLVAAKKLGVAEKLAPLSSAEIFAQLGLGALVLKGEQ